MINHIMLFIIAVALGVFGAFMEWNYGLVIAIIIGLTFINIGFFLYVVMQSQNINLINFVLNRNRKEPSYACIIALKNEDIEEAKKQLEKAIHKYRKTAHADTYAFMLAMLNKDIDQARKYAHATKDEGLKEYNIATLDAYEGKGEAHFTVSYPKPWMSAAIKTTHYFYKGNHALYEQYKAETLQLSKGIQHASNLYTFQFNEKAQNSGQVAHTSS
jgi:hypothetical protein